MPADSARQLESTLCFFGELDDVRLDVELGGLEDMYKMMMMFTEHVLSAKCTALMIKTTPSLRQGNIHIRPQMVREDLKESRGYISSLHLHVLRKRSSHLIFCDVRWEDVRDARSPAGRF